ncbi:hypothetical protein [Vallitalea maricola]|uniref:hypothetical protein n=1 Tax=Vallitalea maricola TaxID=3074433 RepID=UPI0030DCC738
MSSLILFSFGIVNVSLGYYLGGIALEHYKTGHICIFIGVITAISGLSTIRIIRNDMTNDEEEDSRVCEAS